MLIELRILLIIASAFVFAFVLWKVRKSQMTVEDTFYWVFFSVLLLVLSVFPQISFFLTKLLGFQAPSNFIFIVIIFLLLIKLFFMSVKISKLEIKLTHLIQKYALDRIAVDGIEDSDQPDPSAGSNAGAFGEAGERAGKRSKYSQENPQGYLEGEKRK